MSDLVERGTTVPVCCYCDAPLSCARCGCEQPADVAQASQDRIEALEARNSSLVEQCDTHAQQKMAAKNRIEALEKALNYVADMTYYGGGAEWHFKLGYDPQEVLAALAPESK